MAPCALWEIFSEFLIFCNVFHEPFGELNNGKIRETKKISATILRFGKYVIIEKSTHVLITTVKTNISIYHFHGSFGRRSFLKVLSIF